MSRLPTPGADSGAWGQLLNDFLSESHKTDGSLKDGIVTQATLASAAVTDTKLADGSVTTAKLADTAVTAAKITDATITGSKLVNGTIAAGKLDSSVNSQLSAASTAVQTVNGKTGTSVSIDYADLPTPPTVTRTYTSGAYPARNSTGVVIWVGPTAPTFGATAAADGDMWINNA